MLTSMYKYTTYYTCSLAIRTSKKKGTYLYLLLVEWALSTRRRCRVPPLNIVNIDVHQCHNWRTLLPTTPHSLVLKHQPQCPLKRGENSKPVKFYVNHSINHFRGDPNQQMIWKLDWHCQTLHSMFKHCYCITQYTSYAVAKHFVILSFMFHTT